MTDTNDGRDPFLRAALRAELATAAEDSAVRLAPFSTPEYAHAAAIGHMRSDGWHRAITADPVGLVTDDPYAESPRRPGGLHIWDAAAAAPATASRGSKPVPPRGLRIRIGANGHWSAVTAPALNRVGRVAPDSRFERPKAPFIFDLLEDPYGWRVLIAAHDMAHDAALRDGSYADGRAVRAHFTRYLCRFTLSRLTGLPLDVRGRWDNGRPITGFSPLGIETSVVTPLRSGTLLVPFNDRQAPYPDRTVAVVAMSVHTEAHPKGFATGSGAWREGNRWSCAPTTVLISGFGMVDAVTHAALCDCRGMVPKLRYGLPPEDLCEAPDIEALIASGAAAGISAKPNDIVTFDWREWLGSAAYRRIHERSPTWPCKCCTVPDYRLEGAPAKPPRLPDDGKETEAYRKQKADAARDLKVVMRMVDDACAAYESRLLGGVGGIKGRRLRNAAYRKARDAMAEVTALKQKAEKERLDGRPSMAAALRKQAKAAEARLLAELG